MYHPYCHSPSALTEYLKQKLRHQRAKRLGRCYALTGHSSRREVSLSGVGSGLSALATCDADMW